MSGVAAHSIGRMPNPATAGVGVLLGALGHASGWPVPVGGSRAITDALAADLLAHGGRIVVDQPIDDVRELAAFDVKLFDTSARGLASIAGSQLPGGYRRALARFRYGDGATKVDFVLDGPIPWADPRVAAAPTVHLGGSRAEGAAAELAVSRGRHPERPYVLLAQPTAFDPSRNPDGVHAIWSYTHVPHDSDVDVRERVIAQIERFAPGFRDRIVATRQTTAAELSRYNRNYHGGDFSAGAVNLRQLAMRPTLSLDPHRTPAKGIYLASSSAPPGPGVHGLPGWFAARSALRHEYGLSGPRLGL
jgi:phytoene dehydrogenase-like protein